MRRIIVEQGIAVVLLVLAVAAGCQCSGDDGAGTDGGSTDGDTDTDADTDGDSDTGTGSDTGPDPCPGEETDVALDPTLEWEPIQEGMECGLGCQQLTGTGGTLEFDVWEDWVVILEDEGQSSPFVTLVDMSNNQSAILDYGFQTLNMFIGHPAIFDYQYFYMGRESAAHEYRYVWGTSVSKGYKLLEPCIGALYELDAWGDWLAYTFEPNNPGMQDLNLLNRETLERRAVTDFGGVGEVTISGDWITFTRVGGNVEIYAYNVTTEELINISDHPSDQFNSRNDGPRVVWTDLRSDPEADYYDWGTYGAADIWFYDIETQELRQITSGNGVQLYPDIHGDWIVWQDYRECPDPDNPFGTCKRVWGYNLATEEERKLSHVSSEHARVWDDRVYFDSRYQDDPPMAAVFAQEIYPDAGPDAGPDGGK